MFAARQPLDFADYLAWQNFQLPEDGSSLELPRVSSNHFRLAAIRDHQRIYEVVNQAAIAA